MNKKRSETFEAALRGLEGDEAPAPGLGGGMSESRFLKRSTGLERRLSGNLEEKTFYWVDPKVCRMCDKHNRAYNLLNRENCADLIEGIKAQGRQEFPAVVRRLQNEEFSYEVICGARRHFAVSWLIANNYTQFKYLIEVRDLSDEEAFRLADIENREREDISDYERAIDYEKALNLYYDGHQKKMALRLEVSEPWISRYLQLAKLPKDIVRAFTTVRHIKERNVRKLRPFLKNPNCLNLLIEQAKKIQKIQNQALAGKSAPLDSKQVIKSLMRAGKGQLSDQTKQDERHEALIQFSQTGLWTDCQVRQKGNRLQLDFPKTMEPMKLREFVRDFINYYYDSKG